MSTQRSNSLSNISGTEESHTESLVRGGVAFLGGLVLCAAALIAQAALLEAVSGPHKKAN